MDKYIGKLLGGRYEIIDVVGVGGMAVVYRARCHVLNRYVAVKILKDEFAKDTDIRRRFSIESQAVAKLSHHNIVSVYDVGQQDGVDYIVMELIEGITLKEYLQKKGCLPWTEALFFAQQIARALVHAHSRGIIHQDIKPQNVIILRDGTAKLTDFGIASFATTQETRVVQEAIGSVHYISPEQAKGSSIDYRTDIYSLGVVLYEMLTGKMPFEGDTAIQVVMQHINAVPLLPSEVQPGIPHGMDDIVMHAMCANINKRYASADKMYTDLEHIKGNESAEFDYSAVSADHGTQNLDADVQRAARSAQGSSARRTATREHKQESFLERLGEHPGLAATVAVVVFAVIALLVTGMLILTGGGSDKVTVPQLLGNYIDDVHTNKEWIENFTIEEAAERVESTRPVGEILGQSIAQGTKVAKGTRIELTVSAGGTEVDSSYSIPEFKEEKLDTVRDILDKYNVQYTTQEEYSEVIESGKVTRTEPVAGDMLPEGETLTLFVSRGKQARDVDVPDLKGKTKKDAETALTERGLNLGSVSEVANAATAGTIIWQSATSGSKVAEGSEINVQISTGQDKQPVTPDIKPEEGGTTDPGSGETTPPPEGGVDTPDATDPAVPVTGSASIPVVFPPDTTTAHVIISINGEVKYDQEHTVTTSQVTIPLVGPIGSQDVTISVNGRADSMPVVFS